MLNFLVEATLYLFAAVISVPFARRLGLGSVLGYILAGIVVGQFFVLFGRAGTDLAFYTEFGVIILLFVLGLELDPKSLWEMRTKLIGLGGLQISVTTVAVALGAYALGFTMATGLAIGMALTLSSTAMVLQTLSEKGLTRTEGGRSSLSVLLTQDIAFIPMLILIPLIALSDPHGASTVAAAAGHHGQEDLTGAKEFFDGLPPWGQLGVTLGSILTIVLVGQYVVRPMFRYVNVSGMSEISIAATLFIVALPALLMSIVGLSPALGTFIAGVMLANSEFRHEMEGNIAPFKGLFLGLFFITVGAGINFGKLFDAFWIIMSATLGLIIMKAAVLLMLSFLFHIAGRDRLLFALGLAQAGEFSFVLLAFMHQTTVINSNTSDVLTLVVTMSMVFTPALFVAYDYISRRSQVVDSLFGDEISIHEPVIIAGTGRFGRMVNDMCLANGFRTTILDSDIRTINMMRKLGTRAFLGDTSRPELLDAAGLASARILVVAIDQPAIITRLVHYARSKRPDLYIVARARDREHVFELYQARADEIVRETFDSSLRAGRYVLQRLGIPEEEARFRERGFFQFNRRVTQELAAVWDPNLSAEENPAYLRRLRELNRKIDPAFGLPAEEYRSEK